MIGRNVLLMAHLSFLGSLSSLMGCSSGRHQADLPTVAHVDIPRFMGSWYVQANIPNAMEKGCTASIEHYDLRPDGDIDVTFTCRKESFDGPEKRTTALAWITNKSSNAEWKVRFFWVLRFPYLVIELPEDYSYTVIGYPDRKYVWIMSRARHLPESTLAGIYDRLQKLGYDTSKIVRIAQP